ncbi:MAG: SIS domain-containing protein [Microthrixaceae bacterium]|nr:SIS domain-containing protein [Microthrixaceae bacterium]
MDDVIGAAFAEHESLMTEAAAGLVEAVRRFASAVSEVVERGGTLFIGGNGGSASDAQHFTAELLGRFEHDRAPIAAVALGVDAPTTTAISNDSGFEMALSRQLEALARPGDAFIAVSTSGASGNVIRAARTARSRGCTVLGLTGPPGSELAELCDLVVSVPSRTVARVQEMHGLCLHAVAATLEANATTPRPPTVQRSKGTSRPGATRPDRPSR